MHAGHAPFGKPALDVGAEVVVVRRVARAQVQVHGRAPVVAPYEAGQRRHPCARTDQQHAGLAALQGKARVGADEGRHLCTRLQAEQMRGAQAAGPLTHADFQKAVGTARGQRVVARHAAARRQDGHQVARSKRRQAMPAQALKPARPGPVKAQNGRRTPVLRAGVILARA